LTQFVKFINQLSALYSTYPHRSDLGNFIIWNQCFYYCFCYVVYCSQHHGVFCFCIGFQQDMMNDYVN